MWTVYINLARAMERLCKLTLSDDPEWVEERKTLEDQWHGRYTPPPPKQIPAIYAICIILASIAGIIWLNWR